MIKTLYLVCAVVVVACLGCRPEPMLPPIVTVPLRGGTNIQSPFPDSSGQLVYSSTSTDRFEATVTLRRLKSSHEYVLSLEGKSGKPGNEELRLVGEDQGGTGVLDMWVGTTDPNGCWSGEFPEVSLPAGKYHVKFLVKDPATPLWTPVLVNDNVRFMVTKNGQTIPPFPSFPWPPPRASASYVVPTHLLNGLDGRPPATLEHVNSRLSKSLEQCGYHEKRYFAICGGFALVTRIEQIDSKGRPKEPRWSVEIGPPRRFSLGDYLKALFMAPRGHYRVLAFLVTPCAFSTRGPPITHEDVNDLVAEGSIILQPSIGKSSFTQRHRVTALIYEFEKRGHKGEVNFIFPGKLQGKTHLKGSGLLAALGGR